MVDGKWVPTRRLAGAFALAVAAWASAGCGALIGVDPGDPIDPDRAPTPATLDDPTGSASPADLQDPPTADAAAEVRVPQADAGTDTPFSEAPDDDAQPSRTADAGAPGADDATPGAKDAMAASTVQPVMAPQPTMNPAPAPGGDVDASTACSQKGDQGGSGSGSGKGPGPGCKS